MSSEHLERFTYSEETVRMFLRDGKKLSCED
jgi:hypothetical protein